MKRVYKLLVIPVVALIGCIMMTPPALAVDVCGGGNTTAIYCRNKDEAQNKVNSTVAGIVNLLLMALGIISIIMIVVGGILFALANGDSSRVAKARNTVIYAVVGLVVALFAGALVNFIFNRIG